MNEELKIYITAQIDDLKRHIDEAQNEVRDLSKTGNKEGKSFGEGMKKGGKAATVALKAVGAAVIAVAGAILGLAITTKEYQAEQAKLATAFETAGASAEVAKQTFSDLYRFMGESDTAVEAANHLAQLTTNEQELAEWTTICQGIYATFGSSLPIESLTEAANETAKTGELTGALSDALLWAGICEADFTAQLAACNTEAEREALIRSTLTGLYSEAAAGYEKNAAAILAENEAQNALNEAMATLGAVALPILTALKVLAAEVLTAITPFVEMIGEGIQGAMNGTAGASEKFAQGLSGLLESLVQMISDALPVIINLVMTLIPVLIKSLAEQLPSLLQAVIFGIVQILDSISSMLPELIPIIIDAVLICVETLLDNLDLLVESGINLIMSLADGLITAIPILIEKLPIIIEKLIDGLVRNAPKLIKSGADLTIKLATGLIQAIPQLVSKIPQIIKSILNGLKQGIKDIPNIGKDLIKGLWNGISDMVGWIGEKIKGFGKNVLGKLKDFFGIHSPSKVMEDEIGSFLALGIGEGFTNEMNSVSKEIEKSMIPLTQARTFSITGNVSAPTALNYSGSSLKGIATDTSYNNLLTALGNTNKPIILQVDKRTLGQVVAEGINDITKITGAIPLRLA